MLSREHKHYLVTLIKGGLCIASGKVQASAPCKAVELYMEENKLITPNEAIVKCESGIMFNFIIGVANNVRVH